MDTKNLVKSLWLTPLPRNIPLDLMSKLAEILRDVIMKTSQQMIYINVESLIFFFF